MNKAAIRFLGVGLFLAGAAFQIHLMVGENDQAKGDITPQAYKQAQTELKNVKNQLAQLQLDLDNAQQEQTASETEKKVETADTASNEATNSVLHIQSGMTSRDISTSLEQAGIIQNKQDFEDYLIAQDLSSKIQIGQFELNSTMTIKQIAEIITK
ncbi:endolytic transglycosylase MltG [Psychrobacillus lasiicapitis]|uniref:Endolytic transglycosylase MltG n=1 Tax=Psychrobacillus lasiicapitis TaxID=1636719 RepID=A0A544TA83_9BACI|nr:endolytic transglycosylase MltG [Psychrobacillus lasiicapitis]TQR14349.1 endolytic transglycosylase MltG [Psychrobacillus lasiicapitis]GGA32115.1 hypothetical protein GCM10011384_22120 [Psychrobacillus lasiicapitis]